MALILASRSPRRHQLLSLFDIAFESCDADIDETPLAEESPEAMTARLATAKATAVYSQHPPGIWVMGGDTTVALDAEILGKPIDREQAVEMLNRLSGRSHRVISAVSLIGHHFSETRINVSEVAFVDLESSQVLRYCDSGEPFDKAGAYGIQGLAGAWVSELRGSYSSVMGLPLLETRLLLEQAGLIDR